MDIDIHALATEGRRRSDMTLMFMLIGIVSVMELYLVSLTYEIYDVREVKLKKMAVDDVLTKVA